MATQLDGVAWRAKEAPRHHKPTRVSTPTTMQLDEWQIRHYTHKSVAQQELSSARVHAYDHACNLDLQILPSKFHLSRKGTAKECGW